MCVYIALQMMSCVCDAYEVDAYRMGKKKQRDKDIANEPTIITANAK